MMRSARISSRWRGQAYSLLCLVLVAVGDAPSWATVPVNPLPTPLYSFDAQSVQVTGPPNFKPADVLEEGPIANPTASIIVPANALGLNMPGDALNGLSFANHLHDPAIPFVLMFSLDRNSTGVAPPDPQLLASCLPFNATDQSTRGTQAGDMYMSTLNYALNGAARPVNRLALTMNNLLVINNYDEGGTDYKALPPGSASGTALGRTAIAGFTDDNVSSSAYQNGPNAPTLPVVRVYFTLEPTSPSLPALSSPQPSSGANIFFNQQPGVAPNTRFATAAALNLVSADAIDAIVVFDFNNDGLFNGTDEVLFSLAPGSPSLLTILGASPMGAAADIYRKSAGLSPIELFAAAAEFGLGAPPDNIDALEILPCADPLACALDRGISGDSVVGGCPTVSMWGLVVLTLLMAVAGTVLLRRKYAAAGMV